MVVWNKDVCKYRESQQQEAQSDVFSRRPAGGLAEGAVPPDYVAKYAAPEAHLQLLRSLDFYFDSFKRLSRLELKAGLQKSRFFFKPSPVVFLGFWRFFGFFYIYLPRKESF